MTEAEKDYDEYFDHGEVEEYINVRDSDQSCHILPLSNTKYNSGDSQFEDDEVDSIVEEEEDGDDHQNQDQNARANNNNQGRNEYRESAPEW